MTRDEYYADRASRLDTLAGPENSAYWQMLVRLSNEFAGTKDAMFGLATAWRTFADWCEAVHGFRPMYDSEGGITGRPDVVDEHKYTLCLLKYGG